MTPRPDHLGARRAGLTLMELMVAVIIMVMMVVAFSQILRKSQQVVTGAQKRLRENSAAKAVLATLREDIRRATANGMLCISQGQTEVPATIGSGKPPRLTILTAGVMRSKIDPVIGMGGLTVVGLTNNNAKTPAVPEVLYYQRWILTPDLPGTLSTPTDVWENFDLARLISMPRHAANNEGPPLMLPNDLNDVVTYMEGSAAFGVYLPAETPAQTQNLWQVLAPRIRALSITWSDGDPDGDGLMNWYGVDYTLVNGTDTDPLVRTDDKVIYSENDDSAGDQTTSPQNRAMMEPLDANRAAWTARSASASQANFDVIQFNAYNSADDSYGIYGPQTYRAMWTHHNQNNWPKAIRIRMLLYGDPNDPTDPGEEYEAICQLGR